MTAQQEPHPQPPSWKDEWDDEDPESPKTVQQESEHCGHECVCPEYRGNDPCKGVWIPQLNEYHKCKHDTRSRPHNPAPDGYFLTRWGLEEYYDAIAHINGRAYADQVWERVERDTRSRPAPSPECTSKVCKSVMDAQRAEAAAQARGDCIEDYTRELKQNIIKSNLPSNCFDRLSMIIHDTVESLRTGGE